MRVKPRLSQQPVTISSGVMTLFTNALKLCKNYFIPQLSNIFSFYNNLTIHRHTERSEESSHATLWYYARLISGTEKG